MSVLSLERVTKRYARGRRCRVALKDVTLGVEPGELVAIWGVRDAGRTTLLRVAAGLEQPDEGVVRYRGRDVGRRRASLLGDGIGYAQTLVPGAHGQGVLEHVALPLLAHGVAPDEADMRARRMLELTGADGCAALRLGDLDPGEMVRVAIAQALAGEPRILLVDEPTSGVDVLERDAILRLLRTIADGEVAVLMTAGEAIGLSGVDRALSISAGELRTEVSPSPGTVIPLRRLPAGGGAASSSSSA